MNIIVSVQLIPPHMLVPKSSHWGAFGLEHYRPICSAWLHPSGQEPQGELIGLASQHLVVMCIYHCRMYFNKPLLQPHHWALPKIEKSGRALVCLAEDGNCLQGGVDGALSCPLAHGSHVVYHLPHVFVGFCFFMPVLGHLRWTSRSRGRPHQCSLTSGTTYTGTAAYLSTSIFTFFLKHVPSGLPCKTTTNSGSTWDNNLK